MNDGLLDLRVITGSNVHRPILGRPDNTNRTGVSFLSHSMMARCTASLCSRPWANLQDIHRRVIVNDGTGKTFQISWIIGSSSISDRWVVGPSPSYFR
jgi:hypothetical protein